MVTGAIAAINGVIILFRTGRGPPYSPLSVFFGCFIASPRRYRLPCSGDTDLSLGIGLVVMLVQVSVTWVKMGVSKNNGTPKSYILIGFPIINHPKIVGKPPKWMVYNGKPYEQMDDLGVFPIFFGPNSNHDRSHSSWVEISPAYMGCFYKLNLWTPRTHGKMKGFRP